MLKSREKITIIEGYSDHSIVVLFTRDERNQQILKTAEQNGLPIFYLTCGLVTIGPIADAELPPLGL